MENDNQPSLLSRVISLGSQMTMFGSMFVLGAMYAESNIDKERNKNNKSVLLNDTIAIDSFNVASTVRAKNPIVFVDTNLETVKDTSVIVQVFNTHDTTLAYKPHPKEWRAFDSTWTYNDLVFEYTDRDVTILTNILYKESKSYDNVHKLIDKYMVMISAVRKAQSSYGSNITTYTRALKTGLCRQFTWRDYFVKEKSGEVWDNCKEVVLNVLNGNIPDFVPYLPHGGGYYWNSRIDTNTKQRKNLEKRYALVYSSVKDHHYFVPEKALLEHERVYLKLHGCSNFLKKNISNGVFCK